MKRSVGFLPVAIVVALVSTPVAHADPITDLFTDENYLAMVVQHGMRNQDPRDRAESIALGHTVCDNIRGGSTPIVERNILKRNGGSEDRAVWVVRASLTYYCPDTPFDPDSTPL